MSELVFDLFEVVVRLNLKISHVTCDTAIQLSDFTKAVETVPHIAYWFTILFAKRNVHLDVTLYKLFCDVNWPRLGMSRVTAISFDNFFVRETMTQYVEHLPNICFKWSYAKLIRYSVQEFRVLIDNCDDFVHEVR